MRCMNIGLAGFFHHNARGDREVYERAVREFGELSMEYGFEFFRMKKSRISHSCSAQVWRMGMQ